MCIYISYREIQRENTMMFHFGMQRIHSKVAGPPPAVPHINMWKHTHTHIHSIPPFRLVCQPLLFFVVFFCSSVMMNPIPRNKRNFLWRFTTTPSTVDDAKPTRSSLVCFCFLCIFMFLMLAMGLLVCRWCCYENQLGLSLLLECIISW